MNNCLSKLQNVIGIHDLNVEFDVVMYKNVIQYPTILIAHYFISMKYQINQEKVFC